jgi:hypothetical protein
MAKKEKVTLVVPNLKPPPSPLKPFTGSDAECFNDTIVDQVCRTVFAFSDPDGRQKQFQACVSAMAGLGPKDEMEGMLSVQMVALHNAAMDCFRRAMISEQTFAGRQQNLNFANKLSRTYALHMEALDKHRGKGQQTVRVEHVTVNAGGQAIVGNVRGGGGAAQKSEEQPHAQVTDAREQEMRSSFEENWQAVPKQPHEER